VCKQYLSSIVDRVISLCLSNDDETPNLPDYFLSYGFTLSRLTHLRSLSLLSFRSVQDIYVMLNETSSLPHLMHLTVVDYVIDSTDDIVSLMNIIWRLPKLTHCHLVPYFATFNSRFEGLKITSSSIEHVSIKNFNFHSCDLSNIFMHTPRLRYFSAILDNDSDDARPSAVTSSVTILNIIVLGSHTMIQLLSSTPNLRHLTIETGSVYRNGHEWEHIIITHLPKIKVFRLNMYFSSTNSRVTELEVDEILDTFRTRFWLDERRWFVRCEWNSLDEFNSIFLYTLPYFTCNGWYNLDERKHTKSTCPNDQSYWSYDNVSDLAYNNEVENSSLPRIRFPNICHLTINLPMPKNIWTIISTLDHLTSLRLSLTEKSTKLELQTLLDRTSRLYSLFVTHKTALQLAGLRITRPPIRRLCLSEVFSTVYFTINQCSALASASFTRWCEVLTINVQDRSCALHLVNKMPNLRSLSFKCREDTWENTCYVSPPVGDEITEWLRDRLPPTCSVSRNPQEPTYIRLWIER
jgi:hypothetical protein